jgi:hypothetical protein
LPWCDLKVMSGFDVFEGCYPSKAMVSTSKWVSVAQLHQLMH